MVYFCGALDTSDIAAAREVIRDGVTGLLHRTGDIDNMAEQVALLVEQPERQQTMGAAARDSILNNFDIRDTARRFVELFREVIGSGVSARTQAF